MSDAIKARLEAQFPKRCGCGREYNHLTHWRELPFAYHDTDDFATQEARHCACLSTITILIAIHDERAE